MASKCNTIMQAIKDKLTEIEGLSEETVQISAIPRESVSGDIRAGILWDTDKGRRSDGDEKIRTLSLIVACVVRVDRLSSDAQLIQLREVYDQVHAKLEELSDSGVDSNALTMEEDPSGIEHVDIDDGDNITVIGSSWTIEYETTNSN